MATFRMPLGGDVTQAFRIFTSAFNMVGNSFSLFTVNMGLSKAPEVEAEVIDTVGSYGSQLGRIGDALAVLVTHFEPKGTLTPEEDRALRALRVMLDEIADIKQAHGRTPLRPRTLESAS